MLYCCHIQYVQLHLKALYHACCADAAGALCTSLGGPDGLPTLAPAALPRPPRCPPRLLLRLLLAPLSALGPAGGTNAGASGFGVCAAAVAG